MGFRVVNYGEEYINKTALDGSSVTVGLYNDSTDGVGETDDLDALTTEPDNTNYSRQPDTVSVVDHSGNWGIETDSELSFDFSDESDSSKTIDGYFVAVTFDSEQDTDGETDHLMFTGALNTERNLGEIDQLTLDAGAAAYDLN